MAAQVTTLRTKTLNSSITSSTVVASFSVGWMLLDSISGLSDRVARKPAGQDVRNGLGLITTKGMVSGGVVGVYIAT